MYYVCDLMITNTYVQLCIYMTCMTILCGYIHIYIYIYICAHLYISAAPRQEVAGPAKSLLKLLA